MIPVRILELVSLDRSLRLISNFKLTMRLIIMHFTERLEVLGTDGTRSFSTLVTDSSYQGRWNDIQLNLAKRS